MSFLYILLSFVAVTFGQPDKIGLLSPFAAAFGYALFWKGLSAWNNLPKRLGIAALWFALGQGIKLSWLTETEFVGPWILAFFAIAILILGTQFAFITLFIPVKGGMSVSRILFIASLWTLLEYSRLYVFSGFPWNPVGLALASDLPSLQIASVVGIYGLSFLVMFTNGFAFNLFQGERRMWWRWLPLAIMPYVFGFLIQTYNASEAKKNGTLSAILVQTAIMQDERAAWGMTHKVLSPIQQWKKIFSLLKPHLNTKCDLIALPEGVVPYAAYLPVYSYLEAVDAFYQCFGSAALHFLPPLHEPLAHWIDCNNGKEGVWAVSNAYLVQGLANLFKADVVAGLETIEEDSSGKMVGLQSAFHFHPGDNNHQDRYDKRVLVPLGEYIPFDWCRSLASHFGIVDSYSPGIKAKIFNSKVPLVPCICYEEAYGSLMREARLLGGLCVINVTNDGWYPGSALPKQHFYHGRLRAVENGIPMLRVCTTGITGAIDAFGQPITMLDPEEPRHAEALHVTLPLSSYKTFYALFGDGPVLLFAFFGLVPFLLIEIKKKRML